MIGEVIARNSESNSESVVGIVSVCVGWIGVAVTEGVVGFLVEMLVFGRMLAVGAGWILELIDLILILGGSFCE